MVWNWPYELSKPRTLNIISQEAATCIQAINPPSGGVGVTLWLSLIFGDGESESCEVLPPSRGVDESEPEISLDAISENVAGQLQCSETGTGVKKVESPWNKGEEGLLVAGWR